MQFVAPLPAAGPSRQRQHLVERPALALGAVRRRTVPASGSRQTAIAFEPASAAAASPGVEGQRVLITGGYSGIGFATALALTRAGADVLIAGRDAALAEKAAAEIRAKAGPDCGPLSTAHVDLASLASVRAFCAEYLDSGRPLDVLINNAGCMCTPHELTVDGLERQFQTNYASHFLLTELLLGRLGASDAGRIVNVSSVASYYGAIATEGDFERAARPAAGDYGRWRYYCNSKLAQVMHAGELQRRLEAAGSSVTVNALHPGIIATKLLSRPWNWWFGAPFVVLFPLFWASGAIKLAKQGAATSVYLASSPEVAGAGGRFFTDCAERAPAAPASDAALCGAFYDFTADLVGL